MTERALFFALLEIDDPEGRAAYLDEACGDQAGLRERVEALLRAHESVAGFMDRPASALVEAAEGAPVREGPGHVVGDYTLLELIGEGGFGLVFLAEQRPVRRRVALKILKAGMDTRQVVARFEAERLVLALMDHPNIARIFGGGETASGRPYFVMEWVQGAPVTEYCRGHGLPVRRRLELFVSVCQAVEHAHQKGIIHRDLKPTNILVTEADGVPQAKVIDFGIAKATGPRLSKSSFTAAHHLLGTPMYMSPEQAELGALDIDTRADIYSLGVLLYEFLTGTTPFEKARLLGAGYDEIRRILREEEPPRPSTRMGPGVAAAADGRGPARRVARRGRDELDWIVLKAMDKDRGRRYETAGALAEDVLRHLRDEPVRACPASPWYRLAKLARRNRPLFAASTALAAGVVLAVAALAVSNVLIRREQAQTRLHKESAEGALRLAERRAAQIREGLEGLKRADALIDRSRWYAYERRWDDAHASLIRAAALRPDHASVWFELGQIHTLLGLWDLAASDFAREFELAEPDTTHRYYENALVVLSLGDAGRYREVVRRARDRFRGTINRSFMADTVRASVLGPGPDADPAELVALAEQVVPRDWISLYLQGLAHYRAGRHDRALALMEESLRLGVGMPWSPLSYPVLAMALHRLGRASEARRALDEASRALGGWTGQAVSSRADGKWVHHQGAEVHWPVPWSDWLECRLLHAEAHRLILGTDPPEDPREDLLRARALAALRRNGEAEAPYERALRRLPDDPQLRLEVHRSRGYSRAGAGRWAEAAEAFGRAVALQPDDAHLRFFAAVALVEAGDLAGYRSASDAMLDRFGETNDPVAACYLLRTATLTDAPLDPRRLGGTLALARPFGYLGASAGGAALYRAGRYEEAVRCLEEAGRVFRLRASELCCLAMAYHRLGDGRNARRCHETAARWIREADNEDLDDLTGTQPAWGDWCERVTLLRLFAEAARVLDGTRTEARR